MLVISKTPLRISFFGGGTDYPNYYMKNGGAVLGATINHYNYISVKDLQENCFEHSIQISYSKMEKVTSVEEIEHPSVRACLQFKKILKNLEIHFFSDLPAHTGLGSSSAFTVGFLHALNALEKRSTTKTELAQDACHVEQRIICENVGSQDQFHAAIGGLNSIHFQKSGIKTFPLDVDSQFLQQHLLLFFTKIRRNASEVLQEQMERTSQGLNDGFLAAMQQMVPMAESLLKKNDMENFGKLLHESWLLKKRLSSYVSNPFIDECYRVALEAGAWGGKLLGAGHGGFLAFVVPPSKQDSVKKALHNLTPIDFQFENMGSSIIYSTC